MKSIKVTPEDEMRRRMARFKELESYQYQNEAASGIPAEVMEKIAAHRVYPLMVPESYKGRSAQAPIKGAPGLVLSIAECPPGDGPAMHIHEQTIENFFCPPAASRSPGAIRGKSRASCWSRSISSPCRRACRASSPTCTRPRPVGCSSLIHVQTAEQSDRISYQPELREEIERKHGKQTVEALDRIGIRFDAGVDAWSAGRPPGTTSGVQCRRGGASTACRHGSGCHGSAT